MFRNTQSIQAITLHQKDGSLSRFLQQTPITGVSMKSRSNSLGRKIRSGLARSEVSLFSRHANHFQSLIEPVYLQRFFKAFDIDCVFDIGANAGQYARMLRKKVGFQGLIISFEPIPRLAEKLITESESDPLWEVHQLALSDRNGETDFNMMLDSQFSSLDFPATKLNPLFVSSNVIAERFLVPVRCLDRHSPSGLPSDVDIA